MTNAIKLSNNETDDAFKNTMKTLRDLIGYDYCTSRLVFDVDGTEVVFVDEGIIGRIRLYADGEMIMSRFPWCADFSSDSSVDYNGKVIRVVSRGINWISGAKEVTLFVNGNQVAKKVDPRLAALTWKQQLHFIFSMTIIGVVIGSLVKML